MKTSMDGCFWFIFLGLLCLTARTTTTYCKLSATLWISRLSISFICLIINFLYVPIKRKKHKRELWANHQHLMYRKDLCKKFYWKLNRKRILEKLTWSSFVTSGMKVQDGSSSYKEKQRSELFSKMPFLENFCITYSEDFDSVTP